ncbi:MAG: 1-deoxy-D-xylulose-5-phosphate synthase [Flavobacteriaceae bacterium]|nr:1-deoxy-D-xylulose-5-phosphate synthase [Flavobacteriaceae bacterium]
MDDILKNINSPKDLRGLNITELNLLANDIRKLIVNTLAIKQGHLGASLGVVELTIALHYSFDTPTDKLIWDVGHQAYAHKILTGRKDVFETNRQWGGISGFPKMSESKYDAFGTGHSSTSISAALGMAIADKLLGNENHHIAVIGDASVASGMAFEAMNQAGTTNANLIIVINDNQIAIDPGVGAFKEYLNSKGLKGTNTEDCFFKAFNLPYYGVTDGHSISELNLTFDKLKAIKGVKVLHIRTIKGKGLKRAEENQVLYHAPANFDKDTGEIIVKSKSEYTKYQDVFGKTLCELADSNPKIVSITPSMISGSSLNYMQDKHPDRVFDVGICEPHAMTLSAGMVSKGLTVYCAMYSTFLQRAYDQIIHDVALQNLPVIFCIDRAGLVGEDGATHHGVFDIAFLRLIPNMQIFCPMDELELRNILYTLQLSNQSPIAIRYPRGYGQIKDWQKEFQPIVSKKAKQLKCGKDIAIISTGTIANNITKAIEGLDVSHYHFAYIKPIDADSIDKIASKYKTIISIEDGTVKGGFGSEVSEYMHSKDYKNKLVIKGVPDEFISHGSVEILYNTIGLDTDGIKETVLTQLEYING